jgi:aspartate-semialdehyde dehydrogenase
MFDNIIIIGATGLVGIEFVKLIGNQDNLILISSNSIGKICQISGKEFKSMNDIDYSKNNMYINCANSDQAIEIESKMNSNSYLIDNSSQYRLNKNVPLIIPEINFEDILNYNSKIIANPNCSTIILAMLLNPFIKNNHKIKRIVVSTYQAASGAGKVGLDELLVQTNEFVNQKDLTTNYWKQQYLFNTFVHNSPIDSNGYCQEENKLINETSKIFNTKINVSPTCIRVPVLRSHCESVNIEFENEIDYETILNLIKNEKETLELLNNNHDFPSSLSSNNKHLVQIGHIRQDFSLDKNKGWNFWISGDQLLRGAAYNAYLIMEKILFKKN